MTDWKDFYPKYGRVYETENGILYRGDALEIMRQLPSESIDIVLTDPPYLISYRTNRRKDKTHPFTNEIQNDDNPVLIDLFIGESFRVMKPNTPFYCFTSWKTAGYFAERIKAHGFRLKNQIVWVKNNHTAGDLKAQYGQKYEIIMYANKGRAPFIWKRHQDVWFFDKVVGREQLHQNQKPVDLLEFVLITHTKPGMVVIDPFIGSGSTAVACEKQGRRWIGVELEQKYCDMVIDRIETEVHQ